MDEFVSHNYQNKNQSLKVSAEDIKFFDSIPTLDMSIPVDNTELNPSDVLNYVFFIYGMPIPVNIFNKFVILSDKEFIPTLVSDSIGGILPSNPHYGENSNKHTKYRMVCIRSALLEKETICILFRHSESNKYLYVIGSRHGGEYSFINKVEPEVSVGGDYPIRINISVEDIYIMNINKSTIKGYESGATNVKIALSMCSYFNPKGYYDIRITDEASIPCMEKRINLSLFQFLTRPVFRLSWYNSFGFGPADNVDTKVLETLQRELQSLKMIEIKLYLETLLTNVKKKYLFCIGIFN